MAKNFIPQVVKAVFASLIFSLAFALIFTFIVKAASLSSGVVKTVNQIFKIISVAVGCLIFIKGERGLLKGALSGALATIATHILFSCIGGSFAFSWINIAELLLGTFAGAGCGLIAARCKQN